MAIVKIVLRKNDKKKVVHILLRSALHKTVNLVWYSLVNTSSNKDWNETDGLARKSHPNSSRLNNFLLKKLREARTIALEAQTEEARPSLTNIKRKLLAKIRLIFFALSEIHLVSLLKRNMIGQHRTEQGRLQIFQCFLGSKNVAFIDLDVNLLNRHCTSGCCVSNTN